MSSKNDRNKLAPITSVILAAQSPFIKALNIPIYSEVVKIAGKTLDCPLTDGEKQVARSANEAMGALRHASVSYIALCIDIRKHQLSPKVARAILMAAGFLPQRVSEVLRVSFVSDDIFNSIRINGLGFKAALLAARKDAGVTIEAEVTNSSSVPHDGEGDSEVSVLPGQVTFAEAAPVTLDAFLSQRGIPTGNDLVPEFIRRGFEGKAFLKKFKDLGGRFSGRVGNYNVIVFPASGF